jgi:hypothetical protein
MSTVHERTEHLPPLVESFLHNFQYTLGFLDRVAFTEAIFHRATHNLLGALTALLSTQPEVVLQARAKQVFLDAVPLPDSYVMQRIFVRFRCPGLRFRHGIVLPELLQCLKQLDSLLKRETAPSMLETPHKQDLHYDWIPADEASPE